MTWQPIETAPRDGTWFLVVHSDGQYEVGRYEPLMHDRYEPAHGGLFRKERVVTYEWEGFNNFHRATHWMPIPPPPEPQP